MMAQTPPHSLLDLTAERYVTQESNRSKFGHIFSLETYISKYTQSV